MYQKLFNALMIALLLASFAAIGPVGATPIDDGGPTVVPSPDTQIAVGPVPRHPKAIDQPNIEDYLRNRERQQLLEAGQTAEAASLAQTGTDRVLVLLVEFTGTDVFTWTQGVSTWDPLGIADPSEFTGTVGDCSNIITETTVFTYTGPIHNELPRPLSPDDRSGDSIWTEDFNAEWYNDFMFENGVVISYTMQDGTPVFEDFTGESVTKYYQDMSSGTYTVTGDIVGWLPIDHSTWYYDADQCPGARSGASTARGVIPGAGNARTLVKDALDAVNAEIDAGNLPGFNWADYDQDGNGIIDRLWVVHAGYGEEDSTDMLNRTDYGEAAVWSHSSSVSPPYTVTDGIAAGPYIMMPENGGIGVFAHEYAHNLGADDLYAYGNGETSAGFWTLMADDWTGYPIGFEPPAVDPWHLDNWGWLDPMVITDTSKVYEFTIGQASSFPGGEDVYRGGKIMLPDGEVPLPVPVWEGDHYWWGGKLNLANAMMELKDPIHIPEAPISPTLSFDLVYDIEDEWDFLWVQASTDSGANWTTLTNANTQCAHDSGWIGGLYGFPDDLCGAGIGGFYGYNSNWPDPELQEFDLSAFAGEDILLRLWYMTDWGTTYSGAFVDSVAVTENGSALFSDDAEASTNWDYQAPWQVSNGNQTSSQNFYLQWRNINDNGGYDSALGDPRWRFGPANTGLLMWYNNNFYTDNEIFDYLTDYPGYGPKGRMLVLDSHPEPYRDPYYVDMGYDNEGGNVIDRSLMRDAPFTLANTVDFSMEPTFVYTDTNFEGRSAVKTFHDSLGYYPGAEYVSRGPGYSPPSYKWVTKQWDASTVVPSKAFYGIDAPGYTANDEFRFDCARYPGGYLSCYWFGSNTGLGYAGGLGDPAEVGGQYGWHVEVTEEAADHTWAKVRVWNSLVAVDSELTPDKVSAGLGDTLHYALDVKNVANELSFVACVSLDTEKVEYVPGSATAGAMFLESCPTTDTTAEQLMASPSQAGAIAWQATNIPLEGTISFNYDVKVKSVDGTLPGDVMIFTEQGELYTSLTSPAVDLPPEVIYMPLVGR